MSKASLLAEKFDGDPKGLPKNVQEAIEDVTATVKDLGERVALAEQLHEVDPDHPLALGPDHGQSLAAYRFEEVDGEIVEVRKETPGGKVKIIHRPDLTPPDEIDPASALEARLRAPEAESE